MAIEKITMYVYLIETKTVHSSGFPALFYLTLVLSTILIWSTTCIRWRPGICGLQARVRVHQPPHSKDCEKLGGGLGTIIHGYTLLIRWNSVQVHSNLLAVKWLGLSVIC